MVVGDDELRVRGAELDFQSIEGGDSDSPSPLLDLSREGRRLMVGGFYEKGSARRFFVGKGKDVVLPLP